VGASCDHPDFTADVDVNRIGTGDTDDGSPRAYMADVRVSCLACGERFEWMGLAAGMSFAHPMVSVDGTELHAPMRPASAGSNFGHGLPGFTIRRTL
jgi:hypothetical protein